jgi:hypothetical protein
MPLGDDLYFLVVFVLDGSLLLACAVYFLREFLIRRDRLAWSARTRRSKGVFVVLVVLTAGLLAVPLV